MFSGFAGALGGSLISGLFGRQSAKSQMNFQRRMSNTAHQREAKDLQAAGLNRILSVTGGPGASSPGGASPTTPDFAGSALGAIRLKQEIENLKATKDKTDAETEFTKSKTGIAEPFKALGGGLGAIATPISEIIQELATKIPASAKETERWLERQKEKIKDYLFEKSHKNPVFHKRGEIKR